MENNASKVELRRISLELLVTSIFFVGQVGLHCIQ
jgi:hypothetical protein